MNRDGSMQSTLKTDKSAAGSPAGPQNIEEGFEKTRRVSSRGRPWTKWRRRVPGLHKQQFSPYTTTTNFAMLMPCYRPKAHLLRP